MYACNSTVMGLMAFGLAMAGWAVHQLHAAGSKLSAQQIH